MTKDNVFVVTGWNGLKYIRREDIAKILLLVIFLVSVLVIVVWFVSAHYAKTTIINEFKAAILANEYRGVEGFEFFTSLQDKRYISYKVRNVADISIAGAGDEGVRKTWEGGK